jgi:hypothetical protein
VLLLLKIFLAPTLVASVTVAARRWGVRVGGVLTALPIVGGPTLCFYAIEQGNPFAANAARATLLGILAIAAFCVVYARTAIHGSWMLSLVSACSVFALMALILYRLRFGGFIEIALAVASLLIAQRLLPASSIAGPPTRRTRWDLPLRMLSAGMLVLVLTSLANQLGAQVSGILTAFPIATIVLAVFTHRHGGYESVASFFRGLLPGLHSFAVFCFVLSFELLRRKLWVAVIAALSAQLVLQTLILWKVSRSVSSSRDPRKTLG